MSESYALRSPHARNGTMILFTPVNSLKLTSGANIDTALNTKHCCVLAICLLDNPTSVTQVMNNHVEPWAA